MNLYVHMILHGRFAYADIFEKKLELLLRVSDTEERIVVHIFKKVSKYRQGKAPNLLAEIDRDIQALKDFGAQGLAKMIEIFLINYE